MIERIPGLPPLGPPTLVFTVVGTATWRRGWKLCSQNTKKNSRGTLTSKPQATPQTKNKCLSAPSTPADGIAPRLGTGRFSRDSLGPRVQCPSFSASCVRWYGLWDALVVGRTFCWGFLGALSLFGWFVRCYGLFCERFLEFLAAVSGV